MIDSKKEEVQKQAVEACLDSMINNKLRGTLEIATGLGKTFISLWMIHILDPKNVLFLAETVTRENNIKEDEKFFEKCYGFSVFENRNIEFVCYQSAYKFKNKHYDFVIADEIHDSLTPSYFQFYVNNSYTHLLGLSATIDKKTEYETEDGDNYTKLDLLNRIAPVIFKYNLKDSIENKTTRDLNIIVIRHRLDEISRNVLVKTKDKEFYTTEKDHYDYYNKKFYQILYQDQSDKTIFLRRFFTRKRNEILYKALSKREVLKQLLLYLNRVIIFGNDIDSLQSLIPTVSSRNTKKQNEQIINDFNEGRIGIIGSFKMLKQGINLKSLDNVIMHSYYGVEKDAIQRIGRLRQAETSGFVFIILTIGTQEQVWFDRMIEPINSKLIYCNNVEEAISIYKKIKLKSK